MQKRIWLGVVFLGACASHAAQPTTTTTTNNTAPPPSTDAPPANENDAQADALIAKIMAASPPPEAFGQLDKLVPTLSAEKQAQILLLGTDSAHPIFVPDISFEYDWADAFDCKGEHAGNMQQALVSGPDGGQLDLLDFDCPDGSHHAIYYSFPPEVF
jgi:hypothetical protein